MASSRHSHQRCFDALNLEGIKVLFGLPDGRPPVVLPVHQHGWRCDIAHQRQRRVRPVLHWIFPGEFGEPIICHQLIEVRRQNDTEPINRGVHCDRSSESIRLTHYPCGKRSTTAPSHDIEPLLINKTS